MTTENTTTIDTPVDDNLDNFAAELFGTKTETPVEDDVNADDSIEDDSLATEQEAPEADETEDEVLDDDDQEEKPTFIPKKKQTAKERIAEITAKYRETERLLEAERQKNLKPAEPVKAPEPKVETARPTADDKNEDGTAKYPLGDFDPDYINDLAQYSIEKNMKVLDEKRQEEERQRVAQTAETALLNEWQEKITKVEYDDFLDSTAKLESEFTSIEPEYGKYLATTIMSMDKGPDVLYYLSQHPEEFRAIVGAGPTRATIALGRLEGYFITPEKANKPRVSNAPEPPKNLNKGRSVARDIPDDTDDLDAFERKFFRKK